MLYDILPPVTLIASLGGIIAIVSRVVLRLRRQEFSEEMKAAALSSAVQAEDSVIRPSGRGITLVKNRLALIPAMLSETASATGRGVKSTIHIRQTLRRRREEKHERQEQQLQSQETSMEGKKIIMPRTSWRDRLAGVAERSRRRADALRSSVKKVSVKRVKETEGEQAAAQPDPPVPERPTPHITLIRKKKAEKVSDPEPVAADGEPHRIAKLFRKEKPPTSSLAGPLAEARVALEESDHQKAEDLLVPYIMSHTKDIKAYRLLGDVELARSHWSEALEAYEQILKINTDAKKVRGKLGYAAMRMGKLTIALQMLQRAQDENPGDVFVLKSLLTIAKRMDNKVLRKSVSETLQKIRQERSKFSKAKNQHPDRMTA